MTTNGKEWNPLDAKRWANALGLVHVPMFGLASSSPQGKHSVLLDGDSSSFALSLTDDNSLVYDDQLLSWAWSANLRHSLIINEPAEQMLLRRWDSPPGSFRKFRLARNPKAAVELLDILDKSPAPRTDDVVLFVLRGFRILRNSLASPDGLDAIKVLNILLLGTESVLRKDVSDKDWRKSRTVQDAIEHLSDTQRELADTESLPSRVVQTNLDEALLEHFLSPEPRSQCRLNPELLLRHASGQLYQEAHLRLEREAQMHLPGLAPDTAPAGILTRDVRFTPPSLARALAQQALDAISDLISANRPIQILDPACGSGVFLQESLRELVQRGYSGKLTLRGFDTSPISWAIARFCLERAKLDAQLDVTIDIRREDSLRNDWGKPDVVLMNPPFLPWERMKQPEQALVKETLGDIARYRVDMTMAFIWRAAQALGQNAVMASLLPAPLFETGSGQEWREALAAEHDLLLLGRFEGYGFFRSSLVEPGFLVSRRKSSTSSQFSERVRIVVAKSGQEDKAIRGMRQNVEHSPSPDEWDAFSLRRSSIESASWMPRFRRGMQRAESLSMSGMGKVEDLFIVHQGIRTGHKWAFVLSAQELAKLPRREKAYFRPIASNSTIHDGVISREQYLFYPYGESGLLLATEADVRKAVPTYFGTHLKPNNEALCGRSSLRDRQWWEPSEPRLSWQTVRQPKIVSTYFGDRGSFAFDAEGDCLVLQGYAWLWKKPILVESPDDSAEDLVEFAETRLPWAYLCILNSHVFEELLESCCPRVQGGQFNLSARFVNRVYLPDLSNDLQVTGDLLEQLARLGRRIHEGSIPEVCQLDEITARAFGLPE